MADLADIVLKHTKDFILSFGLLRGTLLITFLGAHFWIYKLYNARINDKQKQIDDLAKENYEYRDRFIALMDNNFGYRRSKGRKGEE